MLKVSAADLKQSAEQSAKNEEALRQEAKAHMAELKTATKQQ